MIWLSIYIQIISSTIIDVRKLPDVNGEIKYLRYSFYLSHRMQL